MILSIGLFFVFPILLNFALASRFGRNRLVWSLAALPTSFGSTLALLLAGTSSSQGPRPDNLIRGLVVAALASAVLGFALRSSGESAQLPDAATEALHSVGVAGRPVRVAVNFGSAVAGLFRCSAVDAARRPHFVVAKPPEDWEFQCPLAPEWPSSISRRKNEPLEHSTVVDSVVMIPPDAALGMRHGRIVGSVILAKMRAGEFVPIETTLNAALTIRVVDASTLANLERSATKSEGESTAYAGNVFLGFCAVCGAAAIALCFRSPRPQG